MLFEPHAAASCGRLVRRRRLVIWLEVQAVVYAGRRVNERFPRASGGNGKLYSAAVRIHYPLEAHVGMLAQDGAAAPRKAVVVRVISNCRRRPQCSVHRCRTRGRRRRTRRLALRQTCCPAPGCGWSSRPRAARHAAAGGHLQEPSPKQPPVTASATTAGEEGW